MAASPFYRALLRRQVQFLRWQRSRQSQQRRAQSTSPNPGPKPPPRAEDPVPVPNTVAQLSLWQRLGPFTRAAEAYARAQRKRPYVTQLCTTVTIYLCADISAQRMGGGDYDVKRTGRSLIIGAISAIPSYKW